MLYFGRLRAFAAVLWNAIRTCLIGVLQAGPIPKHIAFIMDGNRRFATKQGMQSITGHQQGYLKLLDALQWCLDLGVEAMTVYAFSIDNFRRETQEVEALMTLAEEKLLDLLNHQEIIDTNEVQVRIIGDLSLLPARVQHAAKRVMEATCHHQRCRLSICMAYTSRQEMAHAVHAVQQKVNEGSIILEDVTDIVIEQELYTQGCPPVDLLIRTSGEHRLSDFLLWQSRYAQLVFSNTLWPDYSFWDLLQALVQYQRSYPELQKIQQTVGPPKGILPDVVRDASTLQDRSASRDEGLDQCTTTAHARDMESTVGNSNDDKQSPNVTADVTDAETSDSSASSESRATSPVSSPPRISKNSSPPRLEMSASMLSQHQNPLCVPGHEALVDGQQLQQPLVNLCVPEHTSQTGMKGNAYDQVSCQQPDGRHRSQRPSTGDTAQRNGSKSVLPPNMLRAEADCRHLIHDTLNRRKPYKMHSDSPD